MIYLREWIMSGMPGNHSLMAQIPRPATCIKAQSMVSPMVICFHRNRTAVRLHHPQPIAGLPWPVRYDRVDSHVATGTGDNGDWPPGLTETGLTKNTRVPWGASQGTLVPCVTTPGL